MQGSPGTPLQSVRSLTDASRRKVWFPSARKQLLLKCGVKLSGDSRTVFNYNPGGVANGLNFICVWAASPQRLFKTSVFLQFFVLVGIMHLFRAYVPMNPHSSLFTLNYNIPEVYAYAEKLTPFVLGLFISLMIAKTYYANRGMFGTLFGRSIGFAQMVVAWVRAPCLDEAEAALKAQNLLVRWTNAAFRLMVLECKDGVTVEQLEDDMLSHSLLTEREWNHIKNLPSRCTHIYQWMNNVLMDLLGKGFIKEGEGLLKHMHMQVEEMRAANVFGLPSLPMPYTLIITFMVKMHLFLLAMTCGAAINTKEAEFKMSPTFGCWLAQYLALFLANLLYQGMLDLHGLLYNPNSGDEIGHLPVVNFLKFVKTVSEDLHKHNQNVPYDLDLEMGVRKSLSFSASEKAVGFHSLIVSGDDNVAA